MTPFVFCRWLDSSVQHAQVDTEALPTPSELHSVGFLVIDRDDHIVLSRDHSPDPQSYAWRSSVAIPRIAVLELTTLKLA